MVVRLIFFVLISSVVFFSVFKFVKWYCCKLKTQIDDEEVDLMDEINIHREKEKELYRQAAEGEKKARASAKKFQKIKKSIK